MLRYFKVKVLKSNHILSTVNYLAADDITFHCCDMLKLYLAQPRLKSKPVQHFVIYLQLINDIRFLI